MRLAVFSGRNAVYILEGAGKMQLVGIADLGCDLPDGHPRFFKQLGCTGHAVVQQICLRAFSYRIPKYLAEVASVESADGGNLLNGNIPLIIPVNKDQGLLDIEIPQTPLSAFLPVGRGLHQLVQKQVTVGN